MPAVIKGLTWGNLNKPWWSPGYYSWSLDLICQGFFSQLYCRYLRIVLAVTLALPCWWRILLVFSSSINYDEGIMNYKGNHWYEGGRAGVSEWRLLRLARRWELETSLFTFFHVQHSMWGSHVETCTNELRRILHCCLSVQVLVLRWQWALLAKYFFHCANVCLKNSEVVELKEQWYPLSAAAGLTHWGFLLERGLPAGKLLSVLIAVSIFSAYGSCCLLSVLVCPHKPQLKSMEWT